MLKKHQSDWLSCFVEIGEVTIIQHPSPNYSDRALPIDMLLMHYTGMQTGAEALERLCDPEWQVSSHIDGKLAFLSTAQSFLC